MGMMFCQIILYNIGFKNSIVFETLQLMKSAMAGSSMWVQSKISINPWEADRKMKVPENSRCH